MKIEFDTDDKLPINKTIAFPSMVTVVRAVIMKIANITRNFF